MATTFGFSCLQGEHQDAQKSIKVAFPRLSFKETTLPLGVGALKSGAMLPSVTSLLLLVLVELLALAFFLIHQDLS